MKGSFNRSIAALFTNPKDAEEAYGITLNLGYDKGDINILVSEQSKKQYYNKDEDEDTDLSTQVKQQAASGSAAGGTLGLIAGAIIGSGVSVALPGLGIVAAGPITAALVGAGTGGFAGGVLGAFANAGIPEDLATDYKTGVKEGGTLLIVNLKDDEDAEQDEEYEDLAARWKECGGKILTTRPRLSQNS